MLSNKKTVVPVETAADGAAEIREIAFRTANQAKRATQRIVNIAKKYGKANLVKELDEGEGAELMAIFAKLKALAENHLADTVVEELPTE